MKRAGVLLLLAVCAASCRDRPAASVLLISIDTLRSDRLPAYGYGKGQTPAIDALRRDAVLYKSAWSAVPLTLPSHATVFSGLLPPRHGIRDNVGFSWKTEVATLAQALSARGWSTGAAVSADVLARGTGIERGFSFFDDALPSPNVVERPGTATAAALTGWLPRAGTGHILAFAHLFEPHTPYQPPEPWKSRLPDPYDGEIAAADAVVGELIAAWKARGLYDDSLILFFSDHGEGLLEHGEAEHGVFLYREAIQVPLLVKYPRQSGAGGSVDAPVGLVDLLPTVLREAGAPAIAGIDGVALPRPGESPAPGRLLYAETLYPRLRLGWSDLSSLFDGRFHYIEAPRPELYDVAEDPGERRDLSASLPPAFRTLRLALSKMPRGYEAPAEADPERARKLTALGYLTATSPDAAKQSLPDPKDKITLLSGQPDLAALIAAGDDAGLVRAARETVAKLPAAIDAWRVLADALVRQGRSREAIAALEAGLRASAGTALPSQRLGAMERLAILLVLEERDADAVALGDAAGFAGPEALTALAVARARGGDLAGARRDLEAALAADPAHAEAAFQLGRVHLAAGDPAAAALQLEKAVAADPSLAAGWTELGQARARAGETEKAIAAWKRAVELDPRQYESLYNLAIASGRMGDVATARSALKQFLSSAPESRYPEERREARRLLSGMGGA